MVGEDKSALTAQQRQKIEKWIGDRAQLIKCPVCRERKFQIAEHLVTPIIQSPDGGVNLGGSAYPHFMLICGNCANTLFFNAVMSGVMSPPPDKPEDGNG